MSRTYRSHNNGDYEEWQYYRDKKPAYKVPKQAKKASHQQERARIREAIANEEEVLPIFRRNDTLKRDEDM